MTILTAFYEHLSTDTAITDVVNDRISPVIREQQKRSQPKVPAIEMSVEDSDPILNLCGTGSTRFFEIHLTAWADTYKESDELAESIIDRVHAKKWTGTKWDVQSSQQFSEEDLEWMEQSRLYGKKIMLTVIACKV